MNRRLTCLAAPLLLLTIGACEESLLGDGTDGGTGGTLNVDDHEGDLLVDDFEDGDQVTALGSDWAPYVDDTSGGASVIDPQEWSLADGYAGTRSLSLGFSMVQGTSTFNPYIGLSAGVPDNTEPASFQGLSYYYRGSAHTVRVQTSDVADYDYFGQQLPAAAEWTLAQVRYESLRQQGYGTPRTWDASLVDGLSWQVSAVDGTEGTLELDDIYFEKTIEIVKGPPDLVVLDAVLPELQELESIEIAGVLQKKVMAQLDRGYNITNWLEEGRFESFEYDEGFVEDLANAGFLALRLPIDMDLYITDREGAGDELSLTLHQDFFEILDNFEEWTATHGLSLTIDYHQYDGSLDLTDPASVDDVVALWRAVANHFKDNARDDIYFELMNEPELSSGATAILPTALWTAGANRIIEAIRAEDTVHTLIFGDVNWYGIDQLSARTPFDDDNIVYSFHAYDPFIFTHQGASWTDMGSTHDIPYPYDPERWSEWSSDLGLSANQPAWVWNQFENYHKTGNQNAIYNRVVQAKAWGVTHQKPVIVNEFGAYPRVARREDLVRYYTDLIDVYAELQIPWTHWFMILEADGTVPDDFRAAFHLDQ